jgi:phage terminase large subunit-like protein
MQLIPFKTFLDTQNIISQQHTPPFHIEICDWLEQTNEDPRRILQVFRHGGKSFIIGAYVCWNLLRNPNWTCLLISAKRNLALRNSLFIRTMIENHPLLQHLKNDLYTWKSETFTVEREVMQLNPSVTVSSLGASFTGYHADIVIADDIETSDNCITQAQRDKIKERVSEFGKLANQILCVGTPHTEESIYDHLESVNYVSKKIPVVRTRLKTFEDSTSQTEEYLAWENHPQGMFTHKWLEQQRNETTEGDFNSQYMLIPQSTYQPLVQLEKINYYKEDFVWNFLSQPMGNYIADCKLGNHKIIKLCAAWDAATGLRGRDNSVLSVCAKDENNNVFVHDIKILSAVDEDRSFENQCKEIIATCAKHKIGHVFVEENFSATLANELRRCAREMKLAINVIPKFRTQNKLHFIAQTLEPIIKVGRLFVHENVKNNSPFLEELQAFPRAKQDDCIDATSEAISHLPELLVDISKVAKIHNPLSTNLRSHQINTGMR